MFLLRILLILFVLAGTAYGQNMTPGADPGGNTTVGTGPVYYVSWSDGSDSDSGLTEALAWKSIGKVNTGPSGGDFQPGATILFKRGDTWTGSNLSMDRNGNAANPIIYGSYGTVTDARPKIQGNNVTDIIDARSWIIVDRLHFDNGTPLRISASSNITWQYTEISNRTQTCIKVYHTSSNVLLQFNKIWDCGNYSGGTISNGEGIYLGSAISNPPVDPSNNITVRSNEIFNTTGEGVDIKQNLNLITVEDNVIHASHLTNNPPNGTLGAITIENGSGSYPIATNVTIRRNVIHDFGAQAGIMSAGNPLMINNLIYDVTDGHGIRVRNSGRYYHNTIFGWAPSGHSAIAIDSGASGQDIRHNIASGTTNNIASVSGLFVNAAGENFQLAGGSGALNLSAPLSAVTTDILGVTRPQPAGGSVDYGAYESSVASVPSVPLNPVVVSSVAGVNITLSWSASLTGTPTSYKVYWATAPNTYTNNQSAGLSLSNTVNSLTINTIYYFNIAALNATGESAKSATVSVMATVPVPGQPTQLMLLRSPR